MGFCNGAYAKVWEVKDGKGNYGDARITISRKNKDTDEYENTFSGFVRLVGNANKNRPAEGSRIKIENCDVTNYYSKDKGQTFWNAVIFEWSDADGNGSGQNSDFVNVDPDSPEIVEW